MWCFNRMCPFCYNLVRLWSIQFLFCVLCWVPPILAVAMQQGNSLETKICQLTFLANHLCLLWLQVPEFDGKNLSSVIGFESNQLPANAPIEDRRSAATCLQTRGMLLGVFDGHAGCACAQVKITLLPYAACVSAFCSKHNSGPKKTCPVLQDLY